MVLKKTDFQPFALL